MIDAGTKAFKIKSIEASLDGIKTCWALSPAIQTCATAIEQVLSTVTTYFDLDVFGLNGSEDDDDFSGDDDEDDEDGEEEGEVEPPPWPAAKPAAAPAKAAAVPTKPAAAALAAVAKIAAAPAKPAAAPAKAAATPAKPAPKPAAAPAKSATAAKRWADESDDDDDDDDDAAKPMAKSASKQTPAAGPATAPKTKKAKNEDDADESSAVGLKRKVPETEAAAPVAKKVSSAILRPQPLSPCPRPRTDSSSLALLPGRAVVRGARDLCRRPLIRHGRGRRYRLFQEGGQGRQGRPEDGPPDRPLQGHRLRDLCRRGEPEQGRQVERQGA